MSLFSTTGEPGGLTVDVPPQQIWVSRATGNGSGRATFGDWQIEPRLTCVSIFYGSSVGGQSYARLEAVTGEPATAQVDVEDSGFLLMGDRVCVGLFEPSGFRPLFAGYMVQAQVQLADNSERLTFRLAGPEWAWGAAGKNAGADALVYGQYRRKASADATWVTTPSTITERADLSLVRAARCVFNPAGQKNRTLDKVKVGEDEQGWTFDEPDRGRIEGGVRTDKAAYWTRKQAIHHLLHLYNDPTFTGVSNPAFGDVDPTVSGDVMRDVDVDGMGLYEAITKIAGPGLGLYVDPIPTDGKWGGFGMNVFSRSGGDVADLVLDTRGTSMADAIPSVNRVEAVKDVSKTTNRVVVYGQGVRHVMLRFNADNSLVTTAEKPYTLQPGWTNVDGKLESYANGETDLAKAVVDSVTIDAKGVATSKQWADQYTTAGKEFAKYQHVFRKFVWNESAEHQGSGVTYGKEFANDYFVPDLTGIADAKGFVSDDDYVAGDYARRRRPLLDTGYVLPGSQQRVRVKPIVWITTKYNGQWLPYTRRLPESTYRIDRSMAAVWITVADLAKWRPFEGFAYNSERDGGPANKPPTATWIENKTFATLLYSKQVWLTIAASIEVDMPACAVAERTDDSGSPHRRVVLIRRPDAYLKTLNANQTALGANWAGFSGMTAVEIDDTPDMQTYADQSREAGQDETVQASILCEADYPIQYIGKMASTIAGRDINLTNSSGRGAQIVAVSLDMENMTVEHLTESAAMEVVAAEKNRIARQRVYRQGGIRQ